MAKKSKKPIKVQMKLQVDAGKATPAPPLGPALSQHGINIQDFCTRFNDMTKDQMGYEIPCVLTVFDDRTFDIVLKTPAVTSLLKKAAGINKGSETPNLKKVGRVSKAQVEEIAKTKMPDLNTRNLESAMKIVEGAAKSIGIEVK